jgi:hypothetical protein
MSKVCLQFVVVMNSRKISLQSLLESVETKNRHVKEINKSFDLFRTKV